MTIDEAISSIQHTAARLRERNLRAMTRLESALLPKLSQKPARKQERRTVRMRRNFGKPEVQLLQAIVASPTDPRVAMRQWRSRNDAKKPRAK